MTDNTTHDDCIFCKIAAKKIPSKLVLENEHACAFRDLHPVAPTHILVIPKTHVVSIDDAVLAGGDLVKHVMQLAREAAHVDGLQASGYRLVMNTGEHAGQSVFHWHVHVLGGRPMAWPPG
ncbi:MAG: histidine triad nucleotide-binding protein [Polyangiaceae bacterium]